MAPQRLIEQSPSMTGTLSDPLRKYCHWSLHSFGFYFPPASVACMVKLVSDRLKETNNKLPQRHFVGWERPLAETVGDWLWEQPVGPYADFSEYRIVVPTAESGRNLRRSLTARMPATRQGFLSPEILTPAQCFAIANANRNPAHATEMESAWIAVLDRVPDATREALFGGGGAVSGDGGRSRLLLCVRQLIRLRSLLVEAGMDLHAVSMEDFAETARWKLLAQLEQAYRTVLNSIGRNDPDDLWLETARRPPDDWLRHKWLLVGLPDPIPLLVQALANAKAKPDIHILVAAPAAQADTFDAWGRPTNEWGTTIHLPGDLIAGKIHLSRDAGESVRWIKERCQPMAGSTRSITIGSADSTLDSAIVIDFEHNEIPVHDPKGQPANRSPWPDILKVWRDWNLSGRWDQIERLLAFPAVAGRYAPDMSPGVIQRKLDRFHRKHLVSSLQQALAVPNPADPDIPRWIRALNADRKAMENNRDPVSAIAKWFAGLLEGLRLHPVHDRLSVKVLQHLRQWLKHARNAAIAEPFTCREWIDALLREWQHLHLYPEKDPNAVEILGWLELLWNPRPVLLLCHLNEGLVPESVVGDAFLPDSLRSQLGMPDNASRFRRDAYILRVLLEQRRHHTGSAILIGHSDGEGNPLKPSRLLFSCEPGQLAKRVAEVTREPGEPRPNPAPMSTVTLDPSRVSARERKGISVTAFRQYLHCPFRYFLRYELGMEPHETPGGEMDARDYGSLAHAVIHQLHAEPEYAAASDADTLRKAASKVLDELCTQNFGAAPPVPLLLQKAGLEARLHAACFQIADDRTSGWQPIHSEWVFHDELADIEVAGLPLRGVIDLVEQHRETGVYRLVDYKTSEKGVAPDSAHWIDPSRRSGPPPPAYSILQFRGREKAWADLQLPLYAWVWKQHCGGKVRVGYFNLPKALGETGWRAWDAFDDALLQSAVHCAEGCVRDILNNRFWPPNPRSPFPGGIEDWLDADFLSWIDPDWIAKSGGTKT